MGHVNNANHITYFETARIEYFREVIGEKIDWSREGIILAHTEIDYLRPILLDDEVWVYSRVSRLGTTSYEVEYLIVCRSEDQEVPVASGRSVQVCFDYVNQATMKVPERWIEKVKAYEFTLPEGVEKGSHTAG